MLLKLPREQAMGTILAPDGVALLRSSGLDRCSKRLAARRALGARGPRSTARTADSARAGVHREPSVSRSRRPRELADERAV